MTGGWRREEEIGRISEVIFSFSFSYLASPVVPDVEDVEGKKSLSRKGDPAISRENARASFTGLGKRYSRSFTRVRHHVPANTPESGSTAGGKTGVS